MKDNRKIYEEFGWENLSEKDLKNKTNIIRDAIPKEVKTILDVGCGNGVITNELGKYYHVTGLDSSDKALTFVKTKKLKASCDNILFENDSFDLVLSSELLEHLTDEIFYKTLEEIKRITKKYILISVPFEENIEKAFIQCTECGFIYNRSYHLRSFSIKKLISYFEEYKFLFSKTFGIKVRYYNPFIAKLKHKISSSVSWIPYFWTPLEKRKTTCPNCEKNFVYKYRFNLFAFLCDCLNVIISPKKPYWLLVILEKINC